jgi:acetoin utilization deacetylase AcuC-like enzyme
MSNHFGTDKRMNVYFRPDYNVSNGSVETIVKAVEIARDLEVSPVDGVVIVAPDSVTFDDLAVVHDPDYIEAVRTGEPRELAVGGLYPWRPEIYDITRASTGGAVAAAVEAYLRRTTAGSLSSGLHHAYRDHGSGYCTFNGLALAAFKAVELGARRVLILDLDAHCGGGTASIIAGNPSVEQVDVSVSRFDTYASTPNARLVMATGDDYLEVVQRELERIVDPSSIDVLLYNAGMDPHQEAGGVRGITADTLAAREEMVFSWARSHGVPVAWVLAGGYAHGLTMDDLVGLHRLTVEAAVRHLP